MIELKRDELVFTFPEVHADAKLIVEFQRTLRIPDDEGEYPLPPGLGAFPLRHVDDFAERVPQKWLQRGGVMLPMYQSEAMWLRFDSSYPFAVKVAAGKINAVTGEDWRDGLSRRPQDYLPVPDQPWLDGFCVEKGLVRQFVAMPLGSGYSAEEQITGEAEHGGVQVVAYPMKASAYEELRRQKLEEGETLGEAVLQEFCAMPPPAAPDMSLAAGGKMRQEIYDDPHSFDVWDRAVNGRCFVSLANSLVWRMITGENPPTVPPTSSEYTKAGLPWFEYYADDLEALPGSRKLADLKSVAEMGEAKGDVPLPENEPVTPEVVIQLRKKLGENQVREGRF